MREVIKAADWIIDLGPERGDKGGEIVAEGTPEQVAKEPRSYTGHYLAPLLSKAAGPEAGEERSLPFKSRNRRETARATEGVE